MCQVVAPLVAPLVASLLVALAPLVASCGRVSHPEPEPCPEPSLLTPRADRLHEELSLKQQILRF